jgi:3-hydroxyisobutyrate dehydrogenase-like beta-hydroxyacid dehydrogenase
MAKPRVGFIGVGTMGSRMSRCLLRSGFSLTVHDRNAQEAAHLIDAGARAGASPREVATSSDVVITMLPDTPDVEQVVRGADGLRDGLRGGTVYVDMSTISPTASKALARELAGLAVEMLDAPVTGQPVHAAEGTLGIMVGGKREVFERCLDIFQAMGKRVIHVGPNGAGHTMKLINNLIGGTVLQVVCEGLALAARAGLDPGQVSEVTSAGGARTGMMESRGPTIFARTFETVGFALKLMDKDLRLAAELARELQIPLPTASVAREMYRAAVTAGYGDLDVAALVKITEAMANVEIRARP